MAKTLYVYDKASGAISYTIDNPNSQQIANMKSRGIPGHLDNSGKPILDSYVTVNAITQQTDGIIKFKEIEDYIICSDNKIVANGTHVVTVSNLKMDTSVIIHDKTGNIPFVPTEFDNTIEFTASHISTDPNENSIKFTIHEYGYHPKTYYIPLVEAEA